MAQSKPRRFVTVTASQTRTYGKFSQTFTIQEQVEVTSRADMHANLEGINAFIIEHFAEFEREQISSVPQAAKRENAEKGDYIPKTEPITRILKKVIRNKTNYYAQTQSLHSIGALIPKHIAKEMALDQHLVSDHFMTMRGYFVTYVRQHGGFHVTRIWSGQDAS